MRIHVFNSSALVKELSGGRIEQSVQAVYLALGWIFYSLAGYSMLIYSNASRSWFGLVEAALVLFVSVWGMRYAYQKNGAAEGPDFVIRFTCLLLPVSVNTYLVGWGLFHFLGWVFRENFHRLTYTSESAARRLDEFARYDFPPLITLGFVVGIFACIFLRIGHHLTQISGSRAAPADPAASATGG